MTKPKYLDGVWVGKAAYGYVVRKGDGHGEVQFHLTPRRAAALVRKLIKAGVRP